MKIATRQPATPNGLKYSRDELIKACTMAHCLVSQVENIADYLEGVGLKSPAAVVYRQIAVNVMDKLADLETILINLK